MKNVFIFTVYWMCVLAGKSRDKETERERDKEREIKRGP